MMQRTASVAVFGGSQRDCLWLEKWLPRALMQEIHWSRYQANAVPDHVPDVAVYMGGVYPSKTDTDTLTIWVETEDSVNFSQIGSDARIWLNKPPTNDDLQLDSRHRFLIAHSTNLAEALLLGQSVDIEEDPKLAMWLRNPELTTDKMQTLFQTLEQECAPKLAFLRSLYMRATKCREERQWLAAARTYRKIKQHSLAVALLWRITGPLDLDQDPHRGSGLGQSPPPAVDEKGAPIHLLANANSLVAAPPPGSVRQLAMCELVETWTSDDTCDDGERKKQLGWARTLVRMFACKYARDPQWLSYHLKTHQYSNPYESSTTSASPTIYVCGPASPHVRVQVNQLLHIGRQSIKFEMCADLDDADRKRAKAKEPWSLVMPSSSTFGPLFLRDWHALLEVMPILSAGKWLHVHVGYHLPALETALAVCDAQPKSFTEQKKGVGAPFATLVSAAAPHLPDLVNNSSLYLSSPTIFQPL